MSEVVERAAKAISALDGVDMWATGGPMDAELWRAEKYEEAQAALLAALDPDNLKLYGAVCAAGESAIDEANETGPPLSKAMAVSVIVSAAFSALREAIHREQNP